MWGQAGVEPTGGCDDERLHAVFSAAGSVSH